MGSHSISALNPNPFASKLGCSYFLNFSKKKIAVSGRNRELAPDSFTQILSVIRNACNNSAPVQQSVWRQEFLIW